MEVGLKPGKLESQELYWLSEYEIKTNSNIKEHIRIMALEALKAVLSLYKIHINRIYC